LGAFPIDEKFAGALVREIGSEPEDAHLIEHGLEVQLPFLAVAVGTVPIVPVLFGGASADWHAKAGEVLAGMVAEGDLVVASTDLSHYLNEEEANQVDRHSLDMVMAQDWRGVGTGVLSRECSMCGASAVVAAMAFAKARHAENWTLLDYRTSADASGDYDRVVGYAAISMERVA
jgi:AmmeMemoRadiSam system protein B